MQNFTKTFISWAYYKWMISSRRLAHEMNKSSDWFLLHPLHSTLLFTILPVDWFWLWHLMWFPVLDLLECIQFNWWVCSFIQEIYFSDFPLSFLLSGEQKKKNAINKLFKKNLDLVVNDCGLLLSLRNGGCESAHKRNPALRNVNGNTATKSISHGPRGTCVLMWE